MKYKKEDIIKLLEEGKSYREIQGIIGCKSLATISYYCSDSYKSKCKEKYIKKERVKKEVDKAAVKKDAHKRMLKSRYGLSTEDYEKMYLEQGGRCAICKKSKKLGERTGLQVDHCHSSGKVRGLLCTSCNYGMGGLKDSVELLTNAIKYLTNT